MRRLLQRDVVVCYHNIVPDGESSHGELTLHLPRHEFARQLEALLSTHTVIALDELVATSCKGGRPRAAITFDDAYRGAIRAGFEELAARGLSATMFVAPGILGGEIGWWDMVADDTGVVDDRVRSDVLARTRGKNHVALRWIREQGMGREYVPDHMRTADEDELLDACRSFDMSLGAHGWSHADLTRLEPHEVEEELRASASWLSSRGDGEARWLAYPYGRTSPSVREAARRHFSAAFCCSGGLFAGARKSRCHSLPRVNIPTGISRRGFELLVSGF